MSRNEALAHIEQANHDKGPVGALEVLTKEINGINKGPDKEANAAQLEELATRLQKDGLLPDLAVVWAVKENGLILKDDKVTLDTLDTYRNRATTDPVHALFATSLMERHEKLRDNTWQWFDGVNVTKDDLVAEFNNIADKRNKAMKEDKVLRFFDVLKENDLLNRITPDGQKFVSYQDVEKALKADEAGKPLNHRFLSNKEAKALKDITEVWNDGQYLPYKPRGNQRDFLVDKIMSAPGHKKLESEITDTATTPVAIEEKQKPAAVAAKVGESTTDGSAGVVTGAAKIGQDAIDTASEIKDALPPTDQISKYYIEAGQGFDRVARDVLRREANRAKGSEVRQFNEADVLALSREIAKFNGMKREDMLRLDQKSLNIPALNWAEISAT